MPTCDFLRFGNYSSWKIDLAAIAFSDFLLNFDLFLSQNGKWGRGVGRGSACDKDTGQSQQN
jgi:hypothetical protein